MYKYNDYCTMSMEDATVDNHQIVYTRDFGPEPEPLGNGTGSDYKISDCAWSGAPRARSGVPRGWSGVPRGGSGVPRGRSGVSRTGSGVLRTGSGVPGIGSGVPRTGSGVPRARSGVPRTRSGVPRAWSCQRGSSRNQSGPRGGRFYTSTQPDYLSRSVQDNSVVSTTLHESVGRSSSAASAANEHGVDHLNIGNTENTRTVKLNTHTEGDLNSKSKPQDPLITKVLNETPLKSPELAPEIITTEKPSEQELHLESSTHSQPLDGVANKIIHDSGDSTTEAALEINEDPSTNSCPVDILPSANTDECDPTVPHSSTETIPQAETLQKEPKHGSPNKFTNVNHTPAEILQEEVHPKSPTNPPVADSAASIKNKGDINDDVIASLTSTESLSEETSPRNLIAESTTETNNNYTENPPQCGSVVDALSNKMSEGSVTDNSILVPEPTSRSTEENSPDNTLPEAQTKPNTIAENRTSHTRSEKDSQTNISGLATTHNSTSHETPNCSMNPNTTAVARTTTNGQTNVPRNVAYYSSKQCLQREPSQSSRNNYSRNSRSVERTSRRASSQSCSSDYAHNETHHNSFSPKGRITRSRSCSDVRVPYAELENPRGRTRTRKVVPIGSVSYSNAPYKNCSLCVASRSESTNAVGDAQYVSEKGRITRSRSCSDVRVPYAELENPRSRTRRREIVPIGNVSYSNAPYENCSLCVPSRTKLTNAVGDAQCANYSREGSISTAVVPSYRRQRPPLRAAVPCVGASCSYAEHSTTVSSYRAASSSRRSRSRSRRVPQNTSTAIVPNVPTIVPQIYDARQIQAAQQHVEPQVEIIQYDYVRKQTPLPLTVTEKRPMPQKRDEKYIIQLETAKAWCYKNNRVHDQWLGTLPRAEIILGDTKLQNLLKSKVRLAKFNYSIYQGGIYNYNVKYILELADFNPELSTDDIFNIFKEYKNKIYVKWVNDNQTLLIFKNIQDAEKAKACYNNEGTLKYLRDSSKLSKLCAAKCGFITKGGTEPRK